VLSVHVRKKLREFDLEIGFDVRPAETLVIIGPSGCGKTTMLNMVAGLTEPDEGSIVLGGRTLWDGARAVHVSVEKRNTGYVFQDFALFPHMTVMENVAYGLRARKGRNREIPKRVGEVLSLFGIGHLRDRRPGNLSGGERQRVALARAIACDAEILLLDEPLGSLDAQTRNRVRGEMQRLLRLVQRIVIMVTHDYVDALTFGDRICVVERGQVLQIGDRQELLRHPRSRFVAELTGVNFYEGTVDASREDGLTEIRVGDTRLHAVCDQQEAGDTMVAFFPSDVTLSRQPPSTSAQNVFSSRVEEIVHMGDKVRLALNGALPMCAEITADSLDALALSAGDTVHASVKATAIKIYR
jgi:molybdate transport system ATP-binding protein